VEGSATADSLYFDVFVSDDQLSAMQADKGDRVEISFGSPWVDFTDYIVGEKGGKAFIFRNTNESGGEANLERFISDADYPKGKLKNAENGAEVKPDVPSPKDLRREYVFFGMTRFGFPAINGGKAQQLDRDKYLAFSKQSGLIPDDLSNSVRYTVRSENGALHYSIAMHNRCLGFGRAANMNKVRFVVDVADADAGEEKETVISSSANRFYGRPFYFHQVELPFAFSMLPEGVPQSAIERLKINLDLVYSGGSWKAFGWNVGALVFAKDFISEALSQYSFYAIQLHYAKFDGAPAYERLNVNYDDVTNFDQHEVYILLNDQVYSSKEYRYNRIEANSFFHTVFNLPDGTPAIVLYDYESVDPLGFGEYGHTADEFIYIQKCDSKGGSPILNIGQRIEAASTMVIGEGEQLKLEQVKSVSYAWIEVGKSFEIKVKGKTSADSRTLRYRIEADNRVLLEK
ncbi:MAG: hypothetical protein RLZZ543_225, partial [Bacteroidota bacterium]